MLKLRKDVYDNIMACSKEAYPHECCGALVGKNVNGVKTAFKAVRLENANKERANDRYEINPADLLKVEKESKKEGFEVIGFYHSHPDHPSRPSQFDRDRGWPEYSYLIVAVEKGVAVKTQSWHFEEDNEPFKEEEYKVED